MCRPNGPIIVIKLPTIETERLILRAFRSTDAADTAILMGDRAISDTTINIPYPYDETMFQQWFSGHQERLENNTEFNWAITKREDNILMGAISLMDMAPGFRAELGYWVAVPYWSQGFCTEAAQAIINYALNQLHLTRVYAYHMTRNPASGRVMQKVGMTHEGTLRSHEIKYGKPEDFELYAILS